MRWPWIKVGAASSDQCRHETRGHRDTEPWQWGQSVGSLGTSRKRRSRGRDRGTGTVRLGGSRGRAPGGSLGQEGEGVWLP